MFVWDFDKQALATRAEELTGGTTFPLQMMEYAGTVAYAQEVAFHFAATYERRFDESFGEGAWQALSPEERGRVLAASMTAFLGDLDLVGDRFENRIWDESTSDTAAGELNRNAV